MILKDGKKKKIVKDILVYRNVVCPPVEPLNIIRLKNKKEMVLSGSTFFNVSTILVSV